MNGFEAADALTPGSAAIAVEHVLDLLAQALAESAWSGALPDESHRERLFAHACRIIGVKFGDPDLGPEAIASEIRVSARTLQRVFTERGETVMRRIFDERIDRAAKLLGAPNAAYRSITDIAFACGFNDSSHFTRVFAARTGTTPSRWRKQALLRQG